MIHVTKTFLPPLETYQAYIQGIWERVQLTNSGPLCLELERQLKAYLGVKHLFFCSNGTVAIQVALKALDVSKAVITTPFSYCATSHVVLWENADMIFADVDPGSLCIDPEQVEARITPQTQAILATHVYGIPCAVDALADIARRHSLKLIYDGAHAFGVNLNGRSLLSYGDVSTCSFHATKLFHTVEGGAIITNDDEVAAKIKLYRSFGHVGDDYFSIGINAKNSEFHAAMGLCNLPFVPEIIERRRAVCAQYDALLLEEGVMTRPEIPAELDYNFAYYPVFFSNEAQMQAVRDALSEQEIFTRRYFYPSLNTLDFMPDYQACPVSEDMASRVLCLPLYHDLSTDDVDRIARIVLETVKQYA
ncbi:MAG: DegT/DnrJ/EryC1/StrS family aminotransferase [Cytophagaceae bacterium]|nr:DegT/DnrJ/EryC1/StrS family aminotransferase [Cytophagaceae bacterium]